MPDLFRRGLWCMCAVTVRRVFECRWDIKLLRTETQHQLYRQLFCYKRFRGSWIKCTNTSRLIRSWLFVTLKTGGCFKYHQAYR